MIFFNVLRDDLMVQQQISNSWEHMVGVGDGLRPNRKFFKAL